MPLIQYISKRFSATSLALIDLATSWDEGGADA